MAYKHFHQYKRGRGGLLGRVREVFEVIAHDACRNQMESKEVRGEGGRRVGIVQCDMRKAAKKGQVTASVP